MPTQRDVLDSDSVPASMDDKAEGGGGSVGTEVPEDYVPPDADITESMPPQCSF